MASRDEEEQGGRGFKVQDRRRFVDTAEGAASESDRPHDPPTPEPSPSAASSPGVAHGHDHAHPHEEHGEPHEHAGLGELSFSTFVMGLTTQALMHLGEIPDPAEHAVARDLPAAKQMIDLLGILRDKTRGNLDAAESQLLDSMLYDLRMRFVEVSRGG